MRQRPVSKLDTVEPVIGRVIDPVIALVIVASFLSSLGACSRQTRPSVQTPWERVVGSLDLVVSDPTRDAIHVRTPYGPVSFAPPEAGKAALQAPSLRQPPAHAAATLTDHGALRWHVAGQGFGGMGTRSGKAPGLPEYAVSAGVLFRTPLEGPGVGRPRPVCIAPKGVADDVLIHGRGAAAVAIARGRATLVDLGSCRSRTLDVGPRRILPVAPAFDPSGGFVALAAEENLALTRVDPDAPPPPRFRVVLARTDTGALVDAVPLEFAPAAVHVAAGSLFAQVGDAPRLLLRHPHAALDSVEPWRTPDEEDVAELRERLLDEIRENHTKGRIGEAMDRVFVLERTGLLDHPTDDERALVSRVKVAGRVRLEAELEQASDEGDLFFAAVLDRRAALIDGKRRFADGFGVPQLAVSVAAHRATRIDPALVRRALEAPWREVVDGCDGMRATGVPCVELELSVTKYPTAERVRLRNGVMRRIQRVASSWLSRRRICTEEGAFLLEHTEAGPLVARECDLEVEGWRAAQELDELWSELERIDLGVGDLLFVRLDDGSEREVPLPVVDEPRELLAVAVDEALRLQGEVDRVTRWPAKSGSAPLLRTFLWRANGGGDDLARAVSAEGVVRVTPRR